MNSDLPNAGTGAEEELEDLYTEEEAYEDSDDEEAYSIDAEAFEREAKDAAREYSRSLSQELKIGGFPACL